MRKTFKQMLGVKLMEYENTICCAEAEQNIIWEKWFLYKRNFFSKEHHYKEPPDISHLHQDWWMFGDIPY